MALNKSIHIYSQFKINFKIWKIRYLFIKLLNTINNTNIYPTSGSGFGGTLLTIFGTNFSPIISDQAVLVRNIYCDILSATTTQLKCRIRSTGFLYNQFSSNNIVNVILAASANATCPGNSCVFSFQSPVSSLSSLTRVFDATYNTLQVKAVGTGFKTGDLTIISLYIDNIL